MKDKMMISIIDDNGSKQFSVNRFVQRILVFVIVGVVSVVILCFIVAHFLMSELEVVLASNTKVRDNFQSIYEKNSELIRNIDYKTNELLKVSSKVNELESIINVRKQGVTFHNQDIDLDSLSSIQKDMILKIIPNGNPIKEFASREFPSKSSCSYALNKNTPVYATANGIIDTIRVAGNTDNFIQIRHSYGFSSNYGHLGKVVVQKGDFVTKGQMIGYTGTNPSLYYDLRFLDSPLETASYTSWSSDNFAQVIGVNSSIDWKSLVWALDDIIQLKNYRVGYQNDKYILTY